MKTIYIYHHLGLGDHIICNGLVRELTKEYNKVYIFAKLHNKVAVENMYLYDNKFEILPFNNDDNVRNYIHHNNIKNIIKIGFDRLRTDIKFDKSFYDQYNVPFEYRWSKFKINRNIKKEKELFNKYNIKEKEYCFLHDDPSRKFNIDREKINTDLKIISPKLGLTDNMLDYSYILENAKELHCMDSSFRLLADSLKLNTSNLYYHTYVRGVGNSNVSHSKYDWKIV
jgi:hypothetical protein